MALNAVLDGIRRYPRPVQRSHSLSTGAPLRADSAMSRTRPVPLQRQRDEIRPFPSQCLHFNRATCISVRGAITSSPDSLYLPAYLITSASDSMKPVPSQWWHDSVVAAERTYSSKASFDRMTRQLPSLLPAALRSSFGAVRLAYCNSC